MVRRERRDGPSHKVGSVSSSLRRRFQAGQAGPAVAAARRAALVQAGAPAALFAAAHEAVRAGHADALQNA